MEGAGRHGGCVDLKVSAGQGCSDQAHSSIDKAVIVLGLGQQALRKISVDGHYRPRPDRLRAVVTADRDAGNVRPNRLPGGDT
jgi:glutamate/tyrosine decarboxylase-like PLP-dependent enzyme